MLLLISGAQHNNHARDISKLIDELSAAPVPATDAGRFLCRRHHIDPRIADLLAALAGLGVEGACE